MIITAVFSENGSPKAGLSPVVYVYDLSDDSLVVNGEAMLEVGQGGYKYNFAGFDRKKDYYVVCDGGEALVGAERYSYGSSRGLGDIDFLKQIEAGRWRIVENQMIFYEDDNMTELMRFDLFDNDGIAAEQNVKDRQRV